MTEHFNKYNRIIFIFGIVISLLTAISFPFICSVLAMSSVSGDGFFQGMIALLIGFFLSPVIAVIGIFSFRSYSTEKTLKNKLVTGVFLSIIPVMIMIGIVFISHDPRTNLMIAAAEGNIGKLKALLSENDFNINKIVLYNGSDTYALKEAIIAGNFKIAKILLENGAETNIESFYPPLVTASEQGNYNIVKLLLEYGADTELRIYYGHTALMVAAQEGHKNIVKLLIENGADVNNKNGDESALSRACFGNHLNIVSLLIQHGADGQCKDTSLTN